MISDRALLTIIAILLFIIVLALIPSWLTKLILLILGVLVIFLIIPKFWYAIIDFNEASRGDNAGFSYFEYLIIALFLGGILYGFFRFLKYIFSM